MKYDKCIFVKFDCFIENFILMNIYSKIVKCDHLPSNESYIASSGANLTLLTHGANLTHLLVYLVRIELGSNEKYSNKPIT